MKANRKFVNADEAVSPVIGVILMVAITVVLAAVVFVLVSNLGGDTEATPTMSFDKSEGNDSLTIISASQADWDDVLASGCTTTYVDKDGDGVVDVGEDLTASPSTATGTVTAGQVIKVTHTSGCTLTLTYVPSNALLGSWTFS